MNNDNKLGENLKLILKHRGMKAIELSRETGISHSIINKITLGKNPNPRLATISQIAICLGVNIEQLLGDNPTENLEKAVKIPVYDVKSIALENYSKPKSSVWTVMVDNITSDCFVMIQRDSSMEPLITAGSTLIVNPTLEAKHQDYIVLLKNKNPITRMLVDDGVHKYCKLTNPEFSTDLVEITNEDKIIGVIVSVTMSVYQEN
ncbi:helix-turn-helix domain-containing protein [Piscirickettsia salmonis]|uniref:helix-turn-helix domain-containing protein n=1 Tax=Piscirickettsia salmonis TaxID=1238 RepID=UPI0006BC6B5C|nr:helix-turn-helix domain-containing protein [Piscirickettsia salmonis]ALA26718.1 peptidase [Piscirickettsia salmonis]APS45841.1 hypothetical protein AVI48_15525 [Piscirickettsia salmonis]APS49276.1 hypothetical protein AVI49_16600 [Piscirickettsia salmonis]QGO82335.1 putative HTH-type transcriptional regulator [Piscirickettsia salmonis]QGP24164.1 putative HTH-type transcriptional regulator [Piscirickettsia salmonis]